MVREGKSGALQSVQGISEMETDELMELRTCSEMAGLVINARDHEIEMQMGTRESGGREGRDLKIT